MPWIDLNLFARNELDNIKDIIKVNADNTVDLKRIINDYISDFNESKKKEWMIIGDNYYRNETDILERVRKAVGESGALEPVVNLANNRLVNGFTRKLVDQKVGYLLGNPVNVDVDETTYQERLDEYFDRRFMRKLRHIGTESINKGIAWLHPYYDEKGELCFKKIPSEECIPIWKDNDHTELSAMIRVYKIRVYEGQERKNITKIEYWDTDGVRRFERVGNDILPDVELGDFTPHVMVESVDEEGKAVQSGFNWEHVPFVAFKYNEDELPLVKLIKSLVDDYDKQKSDVANNLEDLPNSIYVVKNYAGQDAATFRRNISLYRVVFTAGDGDMQSVSIDIDTASVQYHQEQNRKDIYEFGRGIDTQSERFGNSPSGIALKFLYADLDLDCDIMESEFQASLEQLMFFINTDIANKYNEDYFEEKVTFVFNRDMLANESEAIQNVNNSQELSQETRLAHHPWVTSVIDELDRIKAEEQAQRQREEELFNSFQGLPSDPRNPNEPHNNQTDDES